MDRPAPPVGAGPGGTVLTYLLVAWTVLVWAGRVRNILADDGGVGELAVPVVLLALAALTLVDRRRGLPALALVTVAVWAVRLPLVVAHDHGIGFKVVHTVLAVVSVGLAVEAWRAVAPSRVGVR